MDEQGSFCGEIILFTGNDFNQGCPPMLLPFSPLQAK